MRIIHSCDWHLGAYLAGHSRLEEQLAAIEEIVGLALREKAQVLVVAGDFFDSRLPMRTAADIARRAAEALTPLVEAGVAVVISHGNHDPPEMLEMMASFIRLGAVHSQVSVPVHVVRGYRVLVLHGVQFVVTPYPQKEILASEAVTGRILNQVDARAERHRMVVEQFGNIVRAMVDHKSFRRELPSVLVGHFTTANAVFPGRDGQEEGFQHDWTSDFAIPGSVFPPVFSYGALGHIHEPQSLHGTAPGSFPFPTRYAGSPITLNFGEIGDSPKSVTVVDVFPDGTVDLNYVPLSASSLRIFEMGMEDLVRFEMEPDAFLGVFAKIEFRHDGTIPLHEINRRLKRLFPRRIVKFDGPKIHVIGEDRSERILSTDTEKWIVSDHHGSVERYVRGTLKDRVDIEALVDEASALVDRAERDLFGGPTGTRAAGDDPGDRLHEDQGVGVALEDIA